MISAMLQYIQRSPDCFHAVEELRQRLLREGYTELRPGRWQLTAGGKYFTTKNGSSLMAFRIPQEAPAGFLLTASHSDSPCFRLRDHAELTGEYIRLSAERYGGMINDSWLDRPLSVAGRVLVRREGGLEARLVDLKRDVALIPRVAIHLNRETNNGVKYDPARDLVALYAAGTGSGSFYREVARTADCAPEDVVAGDLVLYNNQPGTVWGPEGEFVSAPRLDDLACVFACTEGFLTAQERDMVPVLCVFDNEEIGSETKQGAASVFLPETLAAISEALGLSASDHRALLADSMMLSCDNGMPPSQPPGAGGHQRGPVLNGGVVVKHSPLRHGRRVRRRVYGALPPGRVPVRHYANRPDQMGGSTLGNIADTKRPSHGGHRHGPAGMHSCFETMGGRDVEALSAVRACYGNTCAHAGGCGAR
ncbi:MAG: M18 family aminopeptidase [Oscillospiraceae bacterium]